VAGRFAGGNIGRRVAHHACRWQPTHPL